MSTSGFRPSAIAVLEGTYNTDAMVRALNTRRLGRYSRGEPTEFIGQAVARLLDCAKDGNPRVRGGAIASLGWIGDQIPESARAQAAEAVLTALADPVDTVLNRAVGAVIRFYPLLSTTQKDRVLDLVAHCFRTYGEPRAHAVLKSLPDLAPHLSPADFQKLAGEALEGTGRRERSPVAAWYALAEWAKALPPDELERALVLVEERSRSQQDDTRFASCEQIAALAPALDAGRLRRAVGALEALLDDESAQVRERAIHGIRRCKHVMPPEVREQAERAIVRAATERKVDLVQAWWAVRSMKQFPREAQEEIVVAALRLSNPFWLVKVARESPGEFGEAARTKLFEMADEPTTRADAAWHLLGIDPPLTMPELVRLEQLLGAGRSVADANELYRIDGVLRRVRNRLTRTRSGTTIVQDADPSGMGLLFG